VEPSASRWSPHSRLSFIGDGDTSTLVRFNCVRDVIGRDTNPSGRFLSPFFNWAIYLDNWSSGYLVQSNVLHNNVLGGVFFHGGHDNVVVNNILFNTSEAGPGPGQYAHHDFGQVDFGHVGGQGGVPPRNNTFARNIIAYAAPNVSSRLVVDTADDAWRSQTPPAFFDHNVYFWSLGDLRTLASPPLTPLGNWSTWRAAGFDTHSVVADPLFSDPRNGDLTLLPDSPAWSLGFEAISDAVSRC